MTIKYTIEAANFEGANPVYHYKATTTDQETALGLAAHYRGHVLNEGPASGGIENYGKCGYAVRFASTTRLDIAVRPTPPRFEVK